MNIDELKGRIASIIEAPDYKPLVINELAKQLRIPVEKWPEFFKVLKRIETMGLIAISKTNMVLRVDKSEFLSATVLSLTKNGGFAALSDKTGDIFIPKGKLLGAMPTDEVAVKIFSRTGRLPEAQVVKVLKRNFVEFTGTFIRHGKRAYIMPDSGIKEKLEVTPKDIHLAHDKDKVFARIKKYPEHGHEGVASVITSYGPATSAVSCCASVLDRFHIRRDFSAAVIEEAKRVSEGFNVDEGRTDLREKIIFTIDGAHSKDLDDAVSIEKLEDGYILGVHIADVSHYVKPKSELDVEALLRGTSIYYANSVIPMLPKELSNGICSLNPREDRLAFSVFITTDKNGNIKSYELKKSLICSRVKGVYEEINKILDGSADKELATKYSEIANNLSIMNEFALILRSARQKRGALDFDSDDCEIIIDPDGVVSEIKRRVRGEAEKLIEEFMLLANEVVATFASGLVMPFIYRVHEQPDPRKLEALSAALKLAGINSNNIRPGLTPADVSDVLKKIEGTPKAKALDKMVLRSLAKARYTPDNLGHFGLALKYYSQFTSPIRRYPDLAIHRILSDILESGASDSIAKRYKGYVSEASEQSSLREIGAMQVEWDCEAIYKAEYMSFHIGAIFEGVISSVKTFGMYIELENTVEGMVRVEKLQGWFDYDEASMSLYSAKTGVRYSIGDKVKVIVAKADVSSGQVDFELI